MKKLIFLDIDGVLNCHEFASETLCSPIHKDKVERLNAILKATDARIVLSSAWRYIIYRGEANLRGMEWLLRSHGILANRLIGITRKDTMVRGVYDGTPESWPQDNERGAQISDWLLLNYESDLRYLVIDDLDCGITEANHPFVKTYKTIGLTDIHVKQAIVILNRA